MLNIERCNKLADRLISICGDMFLALCEARELKGNGRITSREHEYIQRLLMHSF